MRRGERASDAARAACYDLDFHTDREGAREVPKLKAGTKAPAFTLTDASMIMPEAFRERVK